MRIFRGVNNAFRGVKHQLQPMELLNVRLCSTESSTPPPKQPPEVGKPFESIPSLKMWPIFGTSWSFLPILGRFKVSETHIAQHEKHKQLGDIFRDKFGSLDMVVLFNPEDVGKMMLAEGDTPSRGTLESLKAYRESGKRWYPNPGLLILEGEEWRAFRMRLNPLFTLGSLEKYFLPLCDIARDFVLKIQVDRDEKSEVPDFLDDIYKWALESVAYVALDTRLQCLRTTQEEFSDAKRMMASVQTMFRCMNELEPMTGNVPFWKIFPTPTWVKFTKASDILRSIASKHIKNANDSVLGLNLEKIGVNELTNLQKMLLAPSIGLKGAMSMVEDMLMAGIDSTSHTVGFFLYNMAKNPDIQEELFQSLLQTLPLKELKMSSRDYSSCKYLEYCIKESMRLIPALGGITRILQEDLVLSGYNVPSGTLVAGNMLEMMRDERYFPEPEKFQPERWIDHKGSSFHYLPFGSGGRGCIGQKLARAEIGIVTAEIIRNFKVEYHYEDIGLLTRLVNAPDRNLRLTFIDREYPAYSSDEIVRLREAHEKEQKQDVDQPAQ